MSAGTEPTHYVAEYWRCGGGIDVYVHDAAFRDVLVRLYGRAAVEHMRPATEAEIARAQAGDTHWVSD